MNDDAVWRINRGVYIAGKHCSHISLPHQPTAASPLARLGAKGSNGSKVA